MALDATGPGAPTPVRVAIGGMIGLAAALGIGRFVYTPILPIMAATLHFSKSEAGLIASANFAGYLVGAMAASLSWFGVARKRWLLVGLAVNAAALFAMALTEQLPVFALVRFLAGWASGFVMVFGSALVIDYVSHAGRPRLSSLHFAGPGTGITLSAILVAVLAHAGFWGAGLGWSGLWIANGGVALAAFLFVAWAVPGDVPKNPAAPPAASPAPAPLTRDVHLLAAAYGLVGFGYVITSTFIVTLVRETGGIAWFEPWVWIIVGLSAAPSATLWAIWARRCGAMRAFAHAAIAEAIGVAASVVWPTIPGITLSAILLGGTFVGLTALGLVAVRSMLPGDPRRGIGILTAVFGVGQIVGPWLAGLTHDLTGTFGLATYLAAAALVASAALAAMVDRRTRA